MRGMAVFERTLPHVNIGSWLVCICLLLVMRILRSNLPLSPPVSAAGTIGHVDHGKTTLTAAITKVQAASGSTCAAPDLN